MWEAIVAARRWARPLGITVTVSFDTYDDPVLVFKTSGGEFTAEPVLPKNKKEPAGDFQARVDAHLKARLVAFRRPENARYGRAA